MHRGDLADADAHFVLVEPRPFMRVTALSVTSMTVGKRKLPRVQRLA